jgi:hypothetical protein
MSHYNSRLSAQRLTVANVCAIAGSDPGFFEMLQDDEIEFLASHFSCFNWETLNNIPRSTLVNILERPTLKIPVEDWLYQFVLMKLVFSGREYFPLFRLVHWERVSPGWLHHFRRLTPEYSEYPAPDLTAMSDQVGSGVNEGLNRYVGDRPSIFDRLAKCAGNLHDLGIVMVTAKSNSGAYWSHPRNILDLDSDTAFESANEPNQWICCDFYDRRVSLEELGIISQGPLPISIEVEGAIDEESWTHIHSSPGADYDGEVAYGLPGASADRYRFVRLTQIGLNSNGDYRLALQGLRLFGTIVDL